MFIKFEEWQTSQLITIYQNVFGNGNFKKYIKIVAITKNGKQQDPSCDEILFLKRCYQTFYINILLKTITRIRYDKYNNNTGVTRTS